MASDIAFDEFSAKLENDLEIFEKKYQSTLSSLNLTQQKSFACGVYTLL